MKESGGQIVSLDVARRRRGHASSDAVEARRSWIERARAASANLLALAERDGHGARPNGRNGR
jgi:hypothetical protein